MGRSGLPVAAAVGGSTADGKKTSWPELLGKSFVEAMFVIKSQRQDVLIKILHADDDPPPDFDEHRVCLFLSETATVARTPVVG